ncbi:MAG: TonB-dependent receptor plug domain-containing protein [Gemmatimonadales bacterium]
MRYAFSMRFFFTVSLSTPWVLSAQGSDTVTLPPVVVTATRIPTALDAVPAAVTVLSGDHLRAQGIRTVAEALRAVPGAQVVETGSFGGQTSLFLRGGESDYAKVLLDGVPLNQPGGAFDFANLTTDNVDRIEIVRGPASVLYGSDAVTGVVQIFTHAGRGTPRVTAGVEAGGYGSSRVAAHLAGGGAGADYSLGLEQFESDGIFAFNSQYRNSVVSARLRVGRPAASQAVLVARYGDGDFHFPTNSAGQQVDRNQQQVETGPTLSLDLSHPFGARLVARALVALHRTIRRLEDPQDSAGDTTDFAYAFHSRDRIGRDGVDARIDYRLASATTLSAGVSVERATLQSTNRCTGSFGDCSSPAMDTARVDRGYYLQALIVRGRGSVVAGARLDQDDRFGSFVTYRMGATYRVASATRVRIAVGTAFKAPTFFETFATGFVTGNPDLNPEHSRSWEAGIEQSLAGGRATAAITWFDQRFRDLVDFSFDSTPSYRNVARARARGLEAVAGAALGPAWRVDAEYTYLATRVLDAGFDQTTGAAFAAGQTLLRRPTHSAGLTLGYRAGRRATAGLAVRYSGRRDDLDFSTFPFPRVTLAPRTRADASINVLVLSGQATAPALTLTGRLENLFDDQRREVFNFPTRGRTLFLGGRATFGW